MHSFLSLEVALDFAHADQVCACVILIFFMCFRGSVFVCLCLYLCWFVGKIVRECMCVLGGG